MIFHKSKKEIGINLVGGLGNQLFGYIACSYLEEVRGSKAYFDLGMVPLGFTDHGNLITDFSLGGHFIDSNPGEKSFQNFYIKFLQKIAKFNSISQKIVYILSRHYFSNTLGFDKNLEFLKAPVKIHGYFQTYKYVTKTIEKRLEIEIYPKKISPWLQEKLLIQELIKPIMLHVRQGDYRRLQDTFGILSSDYYKEALMATRKVLPNRELWIFTDDPNGAQEILKGLELGKHEYIFPIASVSDAEVFYLMTKCDAHIIANSTFSFLSALISSNSCYVTYPDTWFKNVIAPNELFPPDWIPIKSTWV